MNPMTPIAIGADVTTPAQAWAGGLGTTGLRGGTINGTTKMQWCEKPSATTGDWFDVTDSAGTVLAFTAQGIKGFNLAVGYLRWVTTGSTNPVMEVVCSGSLGNAAKP